ncbi:hypothetical protein QYH69_31425 [Paraburkholderia sp. SARCC-3016]|nr:hypothetical protein [Paraburkholderia sp. SARCC-3016]
MWEIIFVLPIVEQNMIELVMDGVKGIRSLSEVAIRIVAPFGRETFRCSSHSEALDGVVLAHVEGLDCGVAGSDAAAKPLLAALTCAAAIAERRCRQVLIFVGLELCVEKLSDYKFLLARRFDRAPIIVLTGQCLTSASLISTVVKGGCSFKWTETIMPFPARGRRIERRARLTARAALGLSETDFAVFIPDDGIGQQKAGRASRFARALSKAQHTHVLGDVTALQSRLPSMVLPIQTEDKVRPDVNLADAADMIVCFGSRSFSLDIWADGSAKDSLAIIDKRGEMLKALPGREACDAVDDFIDAIDLLPCDAVRSAESLRSALVAQLQFRASFSFGQSLFAAVTRAMKTQF